MCIQTVNRIQNLVLSVLDNYCIRLENSYNFSRLNATSLSITTVESYICNFKFIPATNRDLPS